MGVYVYNIQVEQAQYRELDKATRWLMALVWRPKSIGVKATSALVQ